MNNYVFLVYFPRDKSVYYQNFRLNFFRIVIELENTIVQVLAGADAAVGDPPLVSSYSRYYLAYFLSNIFLIRRES